MNHRFELAPKQANQPEPTSDMNQPPVDRDNVVDLNKVVDDLRYLRECDAAIRAAVEQQIGEAEDQFDRVKAAGNERINLADRLLGQHRVAFQGLVGEVEAHEALVESRAQIIADQTAKAAEKQQQQALSDKLVERLDAVSEKLNEQHITYNNTYRVYKNKQELGQNDYRLTPDLDRAHTAITSITQGQTELASKYAKAGVTIKRLERELAAIATEKLPDVEKAIAAKRIQIEILSIEITNIAKKLDEVLNTTDQVKDGKGHVWSEAGLVVSPAQLPEAPAHKKITDVTVVVAGRALGPTGEETIPQPAVPAHITLLKGFRLSSGPTVRSHVELVPKLNGANAND